MSLREAARWWPTATACTICLSHRCMKTGNFAGRASHWECVHATLATAAGPYTPRDVVRVCVVPRTAGHPAQPHGRVPARPRWQRDRGGRTAEPSPDPRVHVHSPSPMGPWTALATAPPGDASGGCNMPSIAFHPNGTLFAVCDNGRAFTHGRRRGALGGTLGGAGTADAPGHRQHLLGGPGAVVRLAGALAHPVPRLLPLPGTGRRTGTPGTATRGTALCERSLRSSPSTAPTAPTAPL